VGYNPLDRRKTPRAQLLQRQWDAMIREMRELETPRQRLDRLRREEKIGKMTPKELALLWLDATRRGFWNAMRSLDAK
jgi:hypothetical protein